MLDVENAKIILQAELDKREKYKAKWKKFRDTDNNALVEFYERRCNMFRFRFDGMCDMLYDLGYLAWSNDENEVFIEKRVTDGDVPF